MKAFLFLPAALLLGLLLGAWGPKSELRDARRKTADLEKRLAAEKKDTRMDTLTRWVQIPDRARAARLQPAAPDRARAAGGAVAPAASNAPAATPPAPPPAPSQRKAPTPEDLRARIDEAKELWRTRVDIARSQWVARLNLTEAQAPLFDETVDLMNENLYAVMQRFADRLESGEPLTPEAGTRVMNEMTAVMVETYDTFASFVPQDRQGETSHMELTDFIDPGVAEPLIAVQDKLRGLPRGARHRPLGVPR